MLIITAFSQPLFTVHPLLFTAFKGVPPFDSSRSQGWAKWGLAQGVGVLQGSLRSRAPAF